MPLKPVDRLPHSLSLRTQLVLVTSVLIALAIAVTSLVAISALRAQMVHQLDEEMKASSSSLVSSVGTSQTRQDGAVGSYRGLCTRSARKRAVLDCGSRSTGGKRAGSDRLGLRKGQEIPRNRHDRKLADRL